MKHRPKTVNFFFSQNTEIKNIPKINPAPISKCGARIPNEFKNIPRRKEAQKYKNARETAIKK